MKFYDNELISNCGAFIRIIVGVFKNIIATENP